MAEGIPVLCSTLVGIQKNVTKISTHTHIDTRLKFESMWRFRYVKENA